MQDETGRWLSLDARWLKTQQRSISWVYDAALRAELTNRLGVRWHELADGAGQADLTCIPEQVRDTFSQRTRQVEAKLAELIDRWSAENDGTAPDARQVAALERAAVTTSRPAKRHDLDGHGIHMEWAAQAEEVGFDPWELPGIVPGRVPGSPTRIDRHRLIEAAIDRASRESATWLPTDLSRHLAALLPPTAAATAEDLVELIDGLTRDAIARCVELHPEPRRPAAVRADGRPHSEAVTDRRLTTTAIWREEERLHEWARNNADRTARHDPSRHATIAAAAGTEPLVLITGPAGTGKTTLLADVVAQLRRQQREVIGVAPSGKAADVLAAETGCPAVTLAKLLVDPAARPPRRATVILDEAGMASTDQLAALVDQARSQGWRLVCVGDPHQLPAVGRAGMFANWCDALPAHHLEEVVRFTHAWEAEASLALRRGDPDAARAYNEHRRVHPAHPALIARHIADQHQQLTDRGRTAAITTTTTTMARAINLEIQRRRRPSGARAALADGTTVAVGDVIATRRNDPHLTTDTGMEVRNRHTWTVTRVHRDGSLTVTDVHHGTVTLPAAYVATNVELGWAVTGYGNQGITADHGITVLEPGATRAGLYVAMTRGRESNTAWIPDPTGTLDVETVFADTITRPTRALTAHATRRQLHHGQPQPDRQAARDIRLDRSGMSLGR